MLYARIVSGLIRPALDLREKQKRELREHHISRVIMDGMVKINNPIHEAAGRSRGVNRAGR